ncbi:hypothetical protein [Nocardia mikamii]|uniref:hypothetical protein n=1 Tax=Nocardia mikamii TaxID=508464 RepID=UPI000A93D0F9|nr:hypothetical protein [Nocardia mikamii]
MGSMVMAGSIAEVRALGSDIPPSSASPSSAAGAVERGVTRAEPAARAGAGAAESVAVAVAVAGVGVGVVADSADAVRPAAQGDVDAGDAETDDAVGAVRGPEVASGRIESGTGVAAAVSDAAGLPDIGRPERPGLCRAGLDHGVGLADCPSPVSEPDSTGSGLSSGTVACHISALVIAAHLDARGIGNRCATAAVVGRSLRRVVTTRTPPERPDRPESS